MAQCAECKTRMGFTETNVAREHKGLCVACHVKSLVKQKVTAANKPYGPTNVKSIDNLFTKFVIRHVRSAIWAIDCKKSNSYGFNFI